VQIQNIGHYQLDVFASPVEILCSAAWLGSRQSLPFFPEFLPRILEPTQTPHKIFSNQQLPLCLTFSALSLFPSFFSEDHPALQNIGTSRSCEVCDRFRLALQNIPKIVRSSIFTSIPEPMW
jgi:hypothetical protein